MPSTGDDTTLILKFLGGIAAFVTAIGAPFAWLLAQLEKKATKESLHKMKENLDEELNKKMDSNVFNEYKHTNGLAHDITHSGLKEIKDTISKLAKKNEDVQNQLFKELKSKKDKDQL